jgi:hypothetical protein
MSISTMLIPTMRAKREWANAGEIIYLSLPSLFGSGGSSALRKSPSLGKKLLFWLGI